MVTVGLYIYINDVARRVELFDDEKISITSSVQDVSDISKVRTDFSQSFTVPANENNNSIFSHWYNNFIDGGYDARKRKKAYIIICFFSCSSNHCSSNSPKWGDLDRAWSTSCLI
jgi:hypothetical protein